MKALLLAVLASQPLPARVTGCYDGDTCRVDVTLADRSAELPFGLSERVILTQRDMQVRLCDIDAPEIRGGGDAAIRARDDLLRWIGEAETVTLLVAQKPQCAADCELLDKYGRTLGWLIADGANLNTRQVRAGNARPLAPCPAPAQSGP